MVYLIYEVLKYEKRIFLYFVGFIDSEDEIKTGIAILKQQSALNEKMREEMEHNMHEIVDACNDAAGVLGKLHDDLERIAKSRRKLI